MRPGFLGDVSDSLDPPFSAAQIATRQRLLDEIRGKSMETLGHTHKKRVSRMLQDIEDQEDIIAAQKLIVNSMQKRIGELTSSQTIPPSPSISKKIGAAQSELNHESAKLRQQTAKLSLLHRKLYDYNKLINLLG